LLYQLLQVTQNNMSDQADNTKSQMKKGVLELCILSMLAQQEAYPSDLVELLREADLNTPEGTLYPMLTRLKNANLLTYRWVESSEGPPRKYFSLTKDGKQQLKSMLESWQQLVKSVNTITKKI
jgi:PadR family transcriptional regulator, regulatory protein PadR